jgi:hypothetical protein
MLKIVNRRIITQYQESQESAPMGTKFLRMKETEIGRN